MKRQQKKSFFPKTKKSKQNDHNISSADISDNEISNDKSKDSIDIINYPIIIDNEEQLITANDNIVQIENNSIMEDVNLNVSSELSDNGDNNNDNKQSDNDDISSSDISEITDSEDLFSDDSNSDHENETKLNSN